MAAAGPESYSRDIGRQTIDALFAVSLGIASRNISAVLHEANGAMRRFHYTPQPP